MVDRKTVDYTEKFWPQDNPFKISIARVLPPRTTDGSAPPDAFLIKVKAIVLMVFQSPDDKEMFRDFVSKLERKKSFCGLWTPEISEPYFDSSEASIELTGYLRQGMEEKILHLDHVARGVLDNKAAETEDTVMVEQFLGQLRKGAKLRDAVQTAEKQTKDLFSHGKKVELEIESDTLPQAHRLEPMGPRAKVHKPPPGPNLQKGPPPGGPPLIPNPEMPPPQNEVLDAVALASKERDSEIASSESGLDIHIEKSKPKSDPKKQETRADGALSTKDASATIDHTEAGGVEMKKRNKAQ